MKKIVASLLLLCCSIAAAFPAPLPSEHAVYQVTLNNMPVGTIDHVLRSQNGQYLFELTAMSDLPFPADLGGNEQSEGAWHNGIPQPLHYGHEYNYADKNKQQSLKFSWDTREVVNEINQRRFPVAKNTQDKLSYQLALRQELAQQGKKLTYEVTDGKHLKTYHFTKERQREWVETPIGNIETIRLELISDKGVTRVWAAPEFDYLWVKFEHEQNNGISISALIESLDSEKTAKKES